MLFGTMQEGAGFGTEDARNRANRQTQRVPLFGSEHAPCRQNRCVLVLHERACHAHGGNLEGCSASASATTRPSGMCLSPVGCLRGASTPERAATRSLVACCPDAPPAILPHAGSKQGTLSCEASDEVMCLCCPAPTSAADTTPSAAIGFLRDANPCSLE